MARSPLLLSVCLLLPAAIGGCHEWFLVDADREVNRLIEQRQLAALGETHSVAIDREDGRLSSSDSMYRFVPHPVSPDVPEAFRTRPATTQPAPTSQPADALQEFTLSESLAYAMRNSREFQFVKERLYLTALALSLERHLWTP